MRKKRLEFILTTNRKKEFVCKIKHKNGNIILQTSESYKNKSVMKRILNNVILAINSYDFLFTDETKI